MSFTEIKSPVHFPDLEKKILAFWDDRRIFEKSIQSRPESRPFVFYEGPPTANGKPGIHHVLARSIKDAVCRFQTMRGYRVERKAGWDTHGLPVEIEVEKRLGIESKDQIEKYGVDKFNAECRESVFRYLEVWNELTKKIGYWVDLSNPYITYTNEYIETVWWLLAAMWKRKLLYQGFKILPYCPRCETALSSHETSLGYEEVTERAVTLKFELSKKPGHFVLAWTTTPWTLPGNVALAVGREIVYAEVTQEKENGVKETYYLAKDRLSILNGPYTLLRTFPGSDMLGWRYMPLFEFVNLENEKHRAYYIADADFVTTEEGTGIVHTAVMYGEDDYRMGMKLGLPAVHTVDGKGRFNEHVELWKNRYVKDPELEREIVDYLKRHNRLYKEENHLHTYPFCWRCDSPLLYYAKKSWYLRTTQVKEELIKNNRKIHWIPKEVGEGRFGQWLENNVDWALSRDRYWGTPLNIWICDRCQEHEAIESIEMLKQKSGAHAFDDLHKPAIDRVTWSCAKCGGTMKRTPEVIDCWFDSGAMPYAQMHYPYVEEFEFRKRFPADFIAEGVDQTRGWFYSLLVISTIVSGESAYKACLSNELILDKEGLKMSKSRGNMVDPFQILDTDGADPLRWYLFTVSPAWIPTRFDTEGIQEVIKKFFGTLLNTFSFFVLYANIDAFHYPRDPIAVESRPDIDRWLISTLNSLVQKTITWWSRYDLTKVARHIQDFVIDDLSNWYIRRNRRRFWKSDPTHDKESAYQTLHEVLLTITKLIAPFSPFMAEELYRTLRNENPESPESVHLCDYPDPGLPAYRYMDATLEERMGTVKTVVGLCRAARNEAGIRVRQPLQRIMLAVTEQCRSALESFQSLILEEVNVHQMEFVRHASEFSVHKAVPVFRNLGPKFGPMAAKVAERIRLLNETEIEKISVTGSVPVQMDHTEVTIVKEDIEVHTEPRQGWIIQNEGEITLALDTGISESLLTEGLAREFINRVQNMRKDSQLNVTDRIHLFFEASPVLKSAIIAREEHIKSETLALTMTDGIGESQSHQSWNIDGETVKIGLRKAEYTS